MRCDADGVRPDSSKVPSTLLKSIMTALPAGPAIPLLPIRDRDIGPREPPGYPTCFSTMALTSAAFSMWTRCPALSSTVSLIEAGSPSLWATGNSVLTAPDHLNRRPDLAQPVIQLKV